MEDRLSRVEKKIDQLQEAIISLARVEERLVTVFNRQTTIEQKVSHIEDKVDKLAENVVSSRAAERIVWLCVAAAIGAAAKYMG